MPTSQDDFNTYLDNLRESGVTNMYGAGAYLQQNFSISEKEASTVLSTWMNTFEERHG